jgi:hypothetical protein
MPIFRKPAIVSSSNRVIGVIGDTPLFIDIDEGFL